MRTTANNLPVTATHATGGDCLLVVSDPLPAANRRPWFTLMVLCVSLLIIVIDNTIVNVALPSLVRQPS